MKKIILPLAIAILIVVRFIACSPDTKSNQVEEIQTAKPVTAKNCYTICNIDKNPDLQIVTNVEDQPQIDGIIDSSTYFWQRYHVRTQPVRLVQNYLTKGLDAIKYGWDSGVIINRVQLQCLVENIAAFDSTCINDWEFDTLQGFRVGNMFFFDGLFEFETSEWVNGNHWKYLTTDFKKEFFPSYIPTQQYVYNINFCYYERGIPAQMGDFYYNYFRFPPHDGIYKLTIRFNPQIKGCRAVKETNYTNNERGVELQILNGKVIILNFS